MASSKSTPYEILGVKDKEDNEFNFRCAYRQRILELKQDRLKSARSRNISAEKFRLICRAYETLSDRTKRKTYNESGRWTSQIAIEDYTLQQLAAEPDLFNELKIRLHDATLAEINLKDPDTLLTPLYCAARACNIDAVIFLTEQDADSDITQRTGSTPLHAAVFFGHPEMVRCLLECGANYKIKNDYKNEAEGEANGDKEISAVFQELKQNPYVQAAANQLDWFKENPLTNHIDFQYYTLRQTLLQCASKKGHFDLVQWLVERHEADVDLVDINQNSALHLAAHKGDERIVEYLLNHGTDSRLINKWGMTAEQEGLIHGSRIKKLFTAIRAQNMFKMAADGIYWWFEYYFGRHSVDAVNEEGVSLLYLASRNGHLAVAKWLLEKGANVNIQLQGNSQSTPLHGAVFNDHLAVVELLLSYNADVNIRNKFNETVFDNAKADRMKAFLKAYQANLKENKPIEVHLYGDGAKSGNAPLAKLQLPCNIELRHVHGKMSPEMQKEYACFSIGRRPLKSEVEDMKLISAYCRARYGKSQFFEVPIALTVHESPRYMNSGHVMSPEISYLQPRDFIQKLGIKCRTKSMDINGHMSSPQVFTFDSISIQFPANCVQADSTVDINYLFSPDYETFQLPGCVCIFRLESQSFRKFDSVPTVTLTNDPSAKLYTWTQWTPYWFTSRTGNARLPLIDGIHAFIRHVDVIPRVLRLPADMIIQGATGKPLEKRNDPVFCRCLRVRQHNKRDFPHIAYHGTRHDVLLSILNDGLVMPSTVVSSGFRVCPPNNHIARGVENFGVKDFANGIFVSPSIYYCSDPVYAITFSYEDELLFPVFECSVKNDAFKAFPSTVPDYKPHQTDNVKQIEWRLTNPGAIEILSVLFISKAPSRITLARERADKLGLNPNEVS